MRKIDELANESSCINRALNMEMVFVLLARDPAAARTIEFWCRERVLKCLNTENDSQIVEALACARTMDLERQDVQLMLKDSKNPGELARRINAAKLALTDMIDGATETQGQDSRVSTVISILEGATGSYAGGYRK